MRLVTIQSKNFKSIIDTRLCHLSESDNMLVLAGQNEAGKSAEVESLDFFRNGPSKNFELMHRRLGAHPEVTCAFLFDQQEIEDILGDIDNNDLKKYLMKNRQITFVRGSTEEDAFEEISFSPELRLALETFFEEETPEEPETKEETKTEAATETPTTEEATATPEEDEPITLDEVEEMFVKSLKKFTFYDSFNDLLPGQILVSEIGKSPAVRDFEKVFTVNFAEVIKQGPRAIKQTELRLERAASDNLNEYWRQRLEDGGSYKFSVKIIPIDPETEGGAITDAKIQFYISRGNGDPLYFQQTSKGFKWFSAFNLRLRAIGVDDASIRNLVILIDEPAQGLHEKAQEDVKAVLEELATKGAQIIYTTHYPILIDTTGPKFSRIRLVSNTEDTGTIIQTPAQYAATSKSLDALSPIVTAMGMQGIGSIIEKERLSVVLEGISDHYYLCAFQILLLKDQRICFIPACGVSNVPNVVSVLIGWGCAHKSVFDDDPSTGRKAYNLLKEKFYEKDDDETHKHVFRLKNCVGIEDAFTPSDFIKHVLDGNAPAKKGPNSTLTSGKKELLARLFLEKVEQGKIKKEDLNKATIAKFEEVFDWLYEQFRISEPASAKPTENSVS